MVKYNPKQWLKYPSADVGGRCLEIICIHLKIPYNCKVSEEVNV
jgi:hypothetical protein